MHYSQSAPETIQEMFASIADKYDRANTAFSFGLHKRWNKKLVEAVGKGNHLLDLCAGTGEIAFGFLKRYPDAQATLLDFCPEMLAVADRKGASYASRFETVVGDAQKIPLEEASVDRATISYGIRNVQEPTRCFEEVYRVLTPKGRFGILELTRPNHFLLRPLHRVYTHTLLPLLGKLAAENKEAYRYLARSVATFASPDTLRVQLIEVGFSNVSQRSLLGGAATIILAEK